MRASSNTETIDGRIGVVMCADYCAEHEWGIRDLRNRLGLDGSNGIDGRRIWRPEELYLSVVNGRTFFGTRCHYTECAHRDARVVDGLTSEWDERDFLISAPTGTDDARLLEEIGQAANDGQAFLQMYSSSNPFGRGGLAIGLIDRIPQEQKDRLLAIDQQAEALAAAWEPVKQELDRLLDKPVLHQLHRKYASKYDHQRKLGYFYLGPKQLEDRPVEGSRYPFRLWLNPQEQQIYAHGWYTVEQIKQWARGEGPVIENSTYFRLERAAENLLAGLPADIPSYYGVCPDCRSLLTFGNGPANEVSPIGDHSKKAIARCPECGCPSLRFHMSNDMQRQLERV